MKQDALVTQFSPLQHGREPVKQNVTIDRGAVFAVSTVSACNFAFLRVKVAVNAPISPRTTNETEEMSFTAGRFIRHVPVKPVRE